jgi:hypothetical protein
MKLTSFAASLSLVLLAGCITKPAEPQAIEPVIVTKTKVVDTACSGVKPVFPAKSDILADSTARQIGALYEWGVEHCHWPAFKK